MKRTFLQLLSSLSSNAPDLPFAVRFWDGDLVRYGKGEPEFTLIFHTRHAAKRVLATGVLGFQEEYVAGSIDVEGDFQKLMRLGTDPHIQEISLPVRTRLAIALQSLISAGNLTRSPRNIAHHYSRGNDFYKLYLDETLTYSCAYFKTGNDSLEQAQQQKYQHICRKLQLHEGETLLDVGCGLGYFAQRVGSSMQPVSTGPDRPDARSQNPSTSTHESPSSTTDSAIVRRSC